VDDDPVSMMMLEAALASMGIETHSADTVAKAGCLLTEFTPSIAILDVQLPDGDGTDIYLRFAGQICGRQ
jgi:DNA-binding response OmpR family regulator